MCHTLWHKWHMADRMASIDNEIQIGAQGRGVIPAALRKEWKLKPGDRLILHREGERMVLERRESIENRLWEMFEHIPRDVSLADELIAERREVARREMSESKKP